MKSNMAIKFSDNKKVDTYFSLIASIKTLKPILTPEISIAGHFLCPFKGRLTVNLGIIP